LRELDKVEGIDRYRISSIEPNLLTDEIIDICAKSPKFQHHFHIPIQCGSNKILAMMRRRYTVEKFADRIAAVRRAMPDAFIGIDVIVGFPGESDSDFRDCYNFLESIEPSFLHIFPFSERPGTPAVDMPNKVQSRISTERVSRLEELSARLNRAFAERFIGTEREVLFESTNHDGLMYGYTDNYLRVSAPYDEHAVNNICRVRLDSIDANGDVCATLME
jgi:threonylcarbamoyladenosine tRNA methylthiotransferase MtaB